MLSKSKFSSVLFCVFLGFTFLFFGCTSQNQPSPLPSDVGSGKYSNGQIIFFYPNWDDAEGGDANTFMLKSNGSCVFGASKYEVPSKMFKDYLADHFNSEFNDDTLDYTLVAGNTELKARTKAIYCGYATYTLTFACLGSLGDTSFLESASCIELDLNTLPKLGLIATPSKGDISSLQQSISDGRENGVDVMYWFFSWGQLENNWTLSDYLLEPMAHEGRTAVTMEIFHSNVLAAYPARFSSFNDPNFKEEFADFSVEFVKRYNSEYYFVGNEVDEYLWTHPEDISAFKEILEYTRDRIHVESPNTKVGFTVTYHDALRNNATYITKELADAVDIIGYTCHGYHDLFVYDNVSIGKQYLDALETVVPGKPFAVVETGWSSSPMLNSSEDLQAEFAQVYFDYLENTNAEFVIWFTMHDGDDCTENAESFLTDLPEIKENKEFMDAFKEYMCKLGLKKNDGTPKKSWDVWQERTN